MNKFELDKTMECFGYKKSGTYNIGEQKFYHDGRYFTIVNGKTPKELAQLIYEKYDNNKYKIRVDGNNEHCYPIKDVYIYHIDTIEGLVAFLLETKNYYSKEEQNEYEMEVILNSIYQKILENVNPKLKVYDWMAKENIDFKLRKKIEDFDKVVSPFCNKAINVKDNNFIVHGNMYNEENWFSLTDKESKVSLSTIRLKNGFVLKLYIPTDVSYEIAYHCFDEDGEEVAFEKYIDGELSRKEYNLTHDTFGECYEEKHKATNEDKEYVIKNLEKYTEFAKGVVNKNIDSKQDEKKLVIKKGKVRK